MAQETRPREPVEEEAIDAASKALSAIRSTFLIIGTHGPAGTHYMVGNWGTQTSFDPWRFVMALKKTARTLEYAKRSSAFTVNLVSEEHGGAVRDILRSKGWDGHEGREARVDAPRLPEAFAGFDCRLLDALDVGGDHILAVGEVVAGWHEGDEKALVLDDLGLSYSG